MGNVLMNIDSKSISETQVIVLAGGKAKRMGVDIPKCMLEVAGKKLIDICVESLVKDGFRDFVFLLGHKHEMVTQYLGDGSRYGITARFSIDPDTTMGCGKGKAFKYALTKEKIDTSKRCMIVFPDDLILVPNVHLKFLAHHLECATRYGIDASAMLVPGTEYPYGVALIDDDKGLIYGFAEKPIIDKPTSVGIYIFEHNVYDIVRTLIPLDNASPVELESTILPFLAKNRKLGSFFIPTDSWLPINTMKEHERAGRLIEQFPMINTKPPAKS